MEKKQTLNNVLTAFIAVAIPIFGYFGQRAFDKLDRTYDAVTVMKPVFELQFADIKTKITELSLRLSTLEKRADDLEREAKVKKP